MIIQMKLKKISNYFNLKKINKKNKFLDMICTKIYNQIKKVK